jgi:asparagine synthase (glutamine-hydrolysing)
MCGIAGIVAPDGTVDPLVLQRMNDLLAHRGPDGEGFLFASGSWERLEYSWRRKADATLTGSPVRVGLGHRRLAILDLSDRGLQPMGTKDGLTWVVFNGEIYNHLSIRAQLESRGHVFTSRTDTEVLLHAYVEWGEECVTHLSGMFAFAIWDGQRSRLFCARDRLGIKPFYYATASGSFVFASEIKAILAFPACPNEVDDEAAIAFLAHNNCDYAERTTFRAIRALPAAHALTVDATGRLSLRRYWRLSVETANGQHDTERVAHLKARLVDTVRSHLMSDVRVGSCLSGGLDSSTLVGVIGQIWREQPEAAAAIGDRLYTFTSCYDDQKAFDEREYALAVARSVGATPHLVFPTAADFWSDFHKMAWHQDMPFGGLSYYAQWRVMRAAGEAGVKVLIDGQGGDEVFGGYAKFRYAYLLSLMQSHRWVSFSRELSGMLNRADPYVRDLRNGYRYLPGRLRRWLNVDSVLQQVMTGDWQKAVASESTPATRWWRHAGSNGSGATLMQRIQIDDIVTDTLPQLLRMEDRSSMAFSIESRVPLLDHDVVEYGLSLPDHLKVQRGWSKFAMREAMAGILPEPVRMRSTKLGFSAPDRGWLADDLRGPIADLLHSDLRCRRFIDVPKLRGWHASSEAGDANTASYIGLFRILSLEMWMRAFSVS